MNLSINRGVSIKWSTMALFNPFQDFGNGSNYFSAAKSCVRVVMHPAKNQAQIDSTIGSGKTTLNVHHTTTERCIRIRIGIRPVCAEHSGALKNWLATRSIDHLVQGLVKVETMAWKECTNTECRKW
mmetsp:Transcript_16789/g.46054  ORF Transcript_16789/g.46054 Transcript_16789/m.46054 type:complete len:127 (+) Transcript_16789:55-435(+)